MEKQILSVETTVNAPIDVVWKRWTDATDIVNWYVATDTWHTPRAVNDFRETGSFLYRMEAKDGSFGFDFEGIYEEIKALQLIKFTIVDGRKATVLFTAQNDTCNVLETFEAESTNPLDMQRAGWQAILDNFKRYVESFNS